MAHEPGYSPEQVIMRLSPASSSEERARALREFVECWFEADDQAAPPEEPPMPVPSSLRQLYRLANRFPIMSQNRLIPPKPVAGIDGRIVFYVENQDVCWWATDTSADDPPVWIVSPDASGAWKREYEPLSGFLLQLVLFEAISGAAWGASAAVLGSGAAAALCERMAPVPLGAWLWPAHPARFFAREGALLFSCPNDGGSSCWLAARERTALAFAHELADETWEYVNF